MSTYPEVFSIYYESKIVFFKIIFVIEFLVYWKMLFYFGLISLFCPFFYACKFFNCIYYLIFCSRMINATLPSTSFVAVPDASEQAAADIIDAV